MSLKDYGLEGERLRRAVYLDAMEDYQLGDDQACLNYPMRYPTVEFELVDTIGLCEIVDTIRKGKGYRPVLEEGGDTSAWYSMYLGLNGYTSTGLDTSILAIVVNSDSEDNPIINSTMRDYLASEVSEDICRRYIFPEDVMKAHDEGIMSPPSSGSMARSAASPRERSLTLCCTTITAPSVWAMPVCASAYTG